MSEDSGPLAGGCIAQVTLVCDDLPAALAFYRDLLGAEELYADDAWIVVRLAGFLVTIVSAGEGARLVSPVELGDDPGRRALLTVEVGDLDDAADRLAGAGVVLLSEPTARPWGPRTATFADPAGHLWEITQAP